jgi:hypothetical protein
MNVKLYKLILILIKLFNFNFFLFFIKFVSSL